MAKLTLSDIAAGYGAPATLNANNAAIETALENTLSRDGSDPNNMESDLDMDSNRIINLGSPVDSNDAARWIDVTNSVNLTGVAVPALAGNANKHLVTDGSSLSWAYPYIRTSAEISAGVTPTSYYYIPRPVIDVRRYGAVLDGTSDDTTAFTNAIKVANAQGGGRVIFDGPTKLKNVPLLSNVELVGVGGQIINLSPSAANDCALTGTGTVTGSAANLTGNAAQGAYSITVASTAGFAVGDWIVVSESTYVYLTSGQKLEINRVKALPGGGVITLQNGLMEPYTTAANAKVQKLIPVSNFVLSGFTVVNSIGANGGGIGLAYCTEFDVDGIGVRNAAAFPALRMTTCSRGDVRNSIFQDGQSIASGGSSGLMLDLIESSHDVNIHHNEFYYFTENEIGMRVRHAQFCHNLCRHAADTALNTHGSTNSHILISDNNISDCEASGIAVGYSSDRTFDTDITISRNKIVNSGGKAISVASQNGQSHQRIRVIDNDIVGVKLVAAGTTQGILCQYVDVLEVSRNTLNGATIVNAPDSGISVQNATKVEICNNRVENFTSGYGLQIVNCTDYRASGNRLTNNQNQCNTSGEAGVCKIHDNIADTTTNSIAAAALQWGNSWNAPKCDLTITLTYSSSITPDASLGNRFVITATNNTGFSINAPTNPPQTGTQRITITIRNTAGVPLGTVTWNGVFKMATWTSPATANSRSIDFEWDSTNWIEVSRTSVDVPN